MAFADLDQLIDDRPDDGVFAVNRRAFTDAEIFEYELKHIFERTWNFLGFEAQVAKPHDFLTTWIGRLPILVTRDRAGNLNAFLNKCRHKGARVCQELQGSARIFVCPYHSWSYDSAGRNVALKDHRPAAYPGAFDALDHGLERIGRVDSYKGLIFGSIDPEVPSLEEHLGEAKFFLDIVMDQGPHGMEPIAGRSVSTFRANWKFQLENGLDPYHLTTVHNTFVEVMSRRRAGAGNVGANSLDWAKTNDQTASNFNFANGHSALVVDFGPQDRRPFIDLDEISRRLSPSRLAVMDLTFNSLVFPNLQLVQNTATAFRLFRPISPDLTEMHYFCIGAIGESAAQRSLRLRAFEDFYNVSGLATPDDYAVYEFCQAGALSGGDPWLQGYSRGMGLVESGANAKAAQLGLKPLDSVTGTLKTAPEVCLHSPYRQWNRMLQSGLAEAAE